MRTSSARLKHAPRFSGPSRSDPASISSSTARGSTPSRTPRLSPTASGSAIASSNVVHAPWCTRPARSGRSSRSTRSPSTRRDGSPRAPQSLRRSLALTLVVGPDALDRRDELAPGLEAVLPCDHEARVFEPARHVCRGTAECLLLAGGHALREFLRPLLVERDRLQTDSHRRPLRLRRFRGPLQLGPGPIAVLHGHDVLRVAEPETPMGLRAEHRRRACQRLLVIDSEGTEKCFASFPHRMRSPTAPFASPPPPSQA